MEKDMKIEMSLSEAMDILISTADTMEEKEAIVIVQDYIIKSIKKDKTILKIMNGVKDLEITMLKEVPETEKQCFEKI